MAFASSTGQPYSSNRRHPTPCPRSPLYDTPTDIIRIRPADTALWKQACSPRNAPYCSLLHGYRCRRRRSQMQLSGCNYGHFADAVVRQ